MSEPFLAEIRIVSFGFAPRGWAFCNGQLLPINQNQALFSLLGTTYGGNGQTTFALPDLRSRVPLHFNAALPLGQRAGEEAHALTGVEVQGHYHAAFGAATATQQAPGGNLWAANGFLGYAPGPPDVTMGVRSSGSGASGPAQPHQNLPPYLVLNFVIALQGIFPSRN